MRIDLEEIQAHLAQRKRWNSVSFNEIEFYENGVKLKIPKDIIIQFEKIGLNNIDFISSGYYKRDLNG